MSPELDGYTRPHGGARAGDRRRVADPASLPGQSRGGGDGGAGGSGRASGLVKARAGEPPTSILLDVMMPGLDGWRVAEELLDDEHTDAIPIVFLTARAELRDRARGIDIGGVDYVTKPFDPAELAPLVLDLVERVERGERDELRREKLSELRTPRAHLALVARSAGRLGEHDRRQHDGRAGELDASERLASQAQATSVADDRLEHRHDPDPSSRAGGAAR